MTKNQVRIHWFSIRKVYSKISHITHAFLFIADKFGLNSDFYMPENVTQKLAQQEHSKIY